MAMNETFMIESTTNGDHESPTDELQMTLTQIQFKTTFDEEYPNSAVQQQHQITRSSPPLSLVNPSKTSKEIVVRRDLLRKEKYNR